MPSRAKRPGLAERIEFLLQETGWSKSRLAREIGASSATTVGNWIRRDAGLEPEYAFILQDKYGWNARWLLEGIGPAKLARLSAEDERILAEIRELPEERRSAALRNIALLLGL